MTGSTRLATWLGIPLLAGVGSFATAGSTAVAAPLPASYSATASGTILGVDVNLTAQDLARADLVHSVASVDSTATPPSTATSANLGAQTGPLGVAATNTEQAPPNSVESGALVEAAALGISTGAISYTDRARWAGVNRCVTGTIGFSRTQTDGASVDPAGLPNVVTTGISAVTTSVELAPESTVNDRRSVLSTATGEVTGVSFLDGAVQLTTVGTPTLTAKATGTTAGSSVTYTPPTTVTADVLGTPVDVAVGSTTTLTVPGVGTVDLFVASDADVNRTVAADGTSATGDVVYIRATVNPQDPSGNPLGSVDLDILPLQVASVAPAGGVECDTTPPVIAITTPADASTTNDPTPAISGTSDVVNGTITLVIDGGEPVTVTTDGNGDWTFTPTTALAEGAHTVTASATDPAGNTATASSGFTVDLTPPAVAVTSPADGSTTTDSTPAISGTSDVVNGTITLVIDGGAPVTVPTDGNGDWTFTPTAALAEGAHTVTASATDPAGNTASDSNDFTVDTRASVAITAPADGSATNDTTPAITGTSDVVNGTVELVLDGGTPVTVPTDGNGGWTFTPTAALAEGAHTVTVSATDAAGNTATASSSFTVDTSPPTVAVTEPADGSTTTDTTPTFRGTSDVANGTIQLLIDGRPPVTVPTDANGDWSYTPTAAFGTGRHTVTVTATDAAGNTTTDTFAFTVQESAGGALPRTGASIAGTALLSLLLVLGGGLVSWTARRRLGSPGR
ncbi:MAG TPA: Ig-like domain-containing protein [Dermatophilaceae bacterium]|nr:Ig-like domain-containing protein [Dermatophilaceae bacterium]